MGPGRQKKEREAERNKKWGRSRMPGTGFVGIISENNTVANDKYNGTIDNATGTSWTVFIKGKLKTVDVSGAIIEGEPNPGDPVKIVGVDVDGIIIADEIEVKEPESD